MTGGNKVPAIKLFGKTISVSKHEEGIVIDVNQQNCCDRDTILKDISLKELNEKNPISEGEVTKSTTLESDQSDTTNNSQQEQTLKRPDKIIPCPRCNSRETKFCYYNNYNVNQPRHFCKMCQRYWTNGGTMRNVPVGAGRRKSKHSSSFSHLQSAGSNGSIGMHSGAIFNFGPNMFCSATDLSGNSDRLGSISTEDQLNKSGSQELLGSDFHGFPIQVPFFASPGFSQPGFPFWVCNFSGSWPTPNSPNQSLLSSNSSSQTTLGKHARDESFNHSSSCDLNNKETLRENNLNADIWVPKTLKIDDPSEASKSSIRETLGIKIETNSFMNKGGLFSDLQSKGGHKENHIASTLALMQANPAAMSRSLNFHETS